MPESDLDVATLLAAAAPAPSLGVFNAAGATIFRGPVRPASNVVPHAAVFVLATGGPPPQPYFRVGAGSASFYQVNVQVRVRSEPEKFGAGQTKALQVRDKLHLATIAGYVACKVLNSEPLYLGKDDTEHDEWSVNATLWFKQ